MRSDIDIARSVAPLDIREIAQNIGLLEDDLILYGRTKAKIKYQKLMAGKDRGELILVTATSPTKAGEGKSTISIALADALNYLKKKTILCLREPSMGPVFGLKGGATGGGYAQVIPMDEINLHFTGDMHAITSANNLISACIDNHIYWGNELKIDESRILFQRCLDVNDRSLRSCEIGGSYKGGKLARKERFNITVASEIMATLCLSNDFEDLRYRLGNIAVAYNIDGELIYTRDLGIVDSLLLLLREAILPNLVQTLEHSPCVIHGGPFANIAHGCNSLIATKFALSRADYVVTEAGFATDLGAEKFLDIKCRYGKLEPSCSVLVTTIRSLKSQADIAFDDLNKENLPALKMGISNLERHLETLENFNLSKVVAINVFESDTENEKRILSEYLESRNIRYSFVSAYKDGSKGAIDLAREVLKEINAIDPNKRYKPLYELSDDFEIKLEKIIKGAYGGQGFELSPDAKLQLNEIRRLSFDKLPLCIAKTPNSLTDNPKVLGRPKDFIIHIKELRLNLGAGFIICIAGNINTLPGLPKQPKASEIYYEKGEFYNLS